jgi:hypothetical protein
MLFVAMLGVDGHFWRLADEVRELVEASGLRHGGLGRRVIAGSGRFRVQSLPGSTGMAGPGQAGSSVF